MADNQLTIKRKPKNPIKFKIQLNEEQKIAKQIVLDNTLTMLAGSAGSGKTFLACQIALDGLFSRRYEKVIITRPTVSKEDIGFLPGNLREKMDPWLQPIYENMYSLYDKDKVAKCLADDQIKIVPLSFMRGNTFLNSMVIVDEAQNVTHNQMEMIVTRIGLNSKMIVCGDKKQVDLKRKSDSGFNFLYKASDHINGLASVTLTTNHRSPIVEELIDFYTNSHKQGLIKL
jgi:phosphate starvation-inducible PhoH-like protein